VVLLAGVGVRVSQEARIGRGEYAAPTT